MAHLEKYKIDSSPQGDDAILYFPMHTKALHTFLELTAVFRIKGKHQVIENRLFVQDDNIFTSAGVTSGIDLALYLVQQEMGAIVSVEITRQMVLFSRRAADDPAHSPCLDSRNHLDQKVHDVQDAILSDPAKAWCLAELARLMNCSERHFTRQFKLSTGVSSKEYIYKIRIALAMQMLQNTTLQIEVIAYKCGFDDPRQFRRIWSRYYSCSPSSYR